MQVHGHRGGGVRESTGVTEEAETSPENLENMGEPLVKTIRRVQRGITPQRTPKGESGGGAGK